MNECRQAGGVGIKLISLFWEIHPALAKCFHSALSRSSPPPSEHGAQLQTDGTIKHCRARLKFDLEKGNLILTVNAKLNGLLTRDILSFQCQNGKER